MLSSQEGEERFSRGGPCAASALPASGSRCPRVALSEDTQRVVPTGPSFSRAGTSGEPLSPVQPTCQDWRRVLAASQALAGRVQQPNCPTPGPCPLSEARLPQGQHRPLGWPERGPSDQESRQSGSWLPLEGHRRRGRVAVLRASDGSDGKSSGGHDRSHWRRTEAGLVFKQSRRGTSGRVPRLSRALSLSDRLLPWPHGLDGFGLGPRLRPPLLRLRPECLSEQRRL